MTVEVEVKNPLQVSLQFTHVHLVGTYTDPQDSKRPVHTSLLTFPEFATFYSQSSNNNGTFNHQFTLPFRVEPFDVLLGPSETKKVFLLALLLLLLNGFIAVNFYGTAT